MRLSNGFVIDKEKTFGELKFTAVRDVFLQNEDGTPSTQLKKRIYDLKPQPTYFSKPFCRTSWNSFACGVPNAAISSSSSGVM